MELKNRDFWRDVALIVLMGIVVNGAVWVLLHTYYSTEMPVIVQDWAPVLFFVIGVGALIENRFSYHSNQPGPPP